MDSSLPGSSKDPKYNTFVETSLTESSYESSGSFSLTCNSKGVNDRRRCKSLSHIHPESYSNGDIRRLKERLLR